MLKAKDKNLIRDLLIGSGKQYIIPIYQREYRWTKEECLRLIKDIKASADNGGTPHFTGSITYQLGKKESERLLSQSEEEPIQGSGEISEFYLVDGQQRIITVLLIVKALNLLLRDREEEDLRRVFGETEKILFVDSDATSSRKFKIVPSKNDEKALKSILSADSLATIERNSGIKKESYIYNNFKTIHQNLKALIEDGYPFADFFEKGLCSLVVVEIMMTNEENAQEIFESINSLGVKLTNADLIRNYLLMSNREQESLYNNLWLPMQDDLIGEENMEDFVKNFLLMKKGYNVRNEDVYKEFVSYAEEKAENAPVDKDALVEELFGNAEIYQVFLRESGSYGKDTMLLMQELRDMGQTTAYPFLLRVFHDHKNGDIDDLTLDKIINLIVVYLARRTICGIPTNSLRSFMLSLYNRVFGKIPENKKKYYESIYVFLKNTPSRNKMPTVEEVENKLVDYPLYKNLKFATYVLYRIENGRYPKVFSERVVADSVTVEHIMAQNLTNEWIDELGKKDAETVHEKYLDTLGNLSLSSRSKNSVMSDESFAKKKDILKRDGSKFPTLNDNLTNLEKFDQKALLDREKALAAKLLERYRLDEVGDDGIRFDDVVEIICEEEPNPVFSNAEAVSFTLFGKESRESDFGKILSNVCKTLLDKNPEKIRELAGGEGYSPWDGEEACLKYSDDPGFGKEIGEGIRLTKKKFRSQYKMDFCSKLLIECGYEPEDLTIFLNKDSIEENEAVREANKSKFIRYCLKELAHEGVLVYDFDSMPHNEKFIKFQLAEMNEVFPKCRNKWDNMVVDSIQYMEIAYPDNELHFTVKSVRRRESRAMDRLLSGNKESLGISFSDDESFNHLRSYPFDIAEIMDSEAPRERFKEVLLPCLEEVKILASMIKALMPKPEGE